MSGSATGCRVELTGVGKRYGTVEALDGVSLQVDPGRFLVLLGPSGSGKTTLLRCLAGTERVSAGRIRFGGTEVAAGGRHVPPERRDLAMVFQDHALWPHLTVLDNVGYALRRRRVHGAAARARASEMLDRVGLGVHARRYPGELSGGEAQRVALARALVARPSLLLFDEPLSSLDADLRERLRVEIATLARDSGATSVYITHDQQEAFALADVVGVLHAGRLVQFDPPEAVYARPATPFVARFTGLAGEFPVDIVGPDGTGALRWWARLPGRDPVTLLGTPIGGVAPGPARLLVRPAAATLVGPGDPAATVRGVVRDAAFRGRGYDHVVATDSGQLSGVAGVRRQAPGSRVGVRLDPAGCLLFGAADEQTSEPSSTRPVTVSATVG